MIRPVQYSLIWVETLRLGVALDVPGVAGAVNAVLDGDDFAWMRDRDVLRTSPAYGAKVFNYLDLLKTWSWEKTCSKDYSCVIRCSLEDAERQGSKNVVVVPNGAVVPDCVRRVPEERVLFVGVLWYEPNSLGVEWFLSYVWPLVHQEVPTVHLDIVGNGPSERILSANGRLGVTVHGFVEELESLYERATLSVVPLHAGGGTRLKVLEALGRGVPVVSTSIGAYGIPLGDSHGLLRRDGVRAFAGACIELLRNKEHDLQRAALMGRESVSKAFQWKNIRAVPTFSEENQLVGVAG